jgi:hypothetical protein
MTGSHAPHEMAEGIDASMRPALSAHQDAASAPLGVPEAHR